VAELIGLRVGDEKKGRPRPPPVTSNEWGSSLRILLPALTRLLLATLLPALTRLLLLLTWLGLTRAALLTTLLAALVLLTSALILIHMSSSFAGDPTVQRSVRKFVLNWLRSSC
jgi:hypothetical protein